MTPRSPRRIGSLEVSGIGLGCMGMSFAYGPADQDEALATLHHALDTGITLLDTADMYGGGANEKLLSTVLADRRDEIVLATKFGILTDPDTGLPSGVDGSPDYVRRCVDASLQRLGVDVIDLYYLHRVDPTRPIEETVGAMADLVAAGKVRELGLSEAGADTLRRASAVHPIAALQSEWSLFSRDIETSDVPAARELGVTVVPYSPLGRGMLTGSAAAAAPGAGDFRATLPRWQADNLDHNLALVDEIRSVAGEVDATAGQVALAWLLAQGDDVVPIPGTKRRTYLDENIGALSVTLTAEQLERLAALRPAGERYPDMSWVAGASA
ncbi:putative aldo/keto reductase [Gordonia polyisoprenivorans NBRC 16320 = JCM 10675]|uniref:Aldo/keto reductase n=1 Tax=Gordonia polyisoprenivorans TaxID=84595 RepID=A0A846WJ00_9ACTN|nr:aldo/keto reductase [Gordonia polyisoprenivorans]NKY00830.1 aldo/keto reductase [Gordonia polyisoprenivorans]GAB22666.1 putative aldo/keto reductase [Gordonia polyisoprenivorans NBRC 16320 = JCM 10675]